MEDIKPEVVSHVKMSEQLNELGGALSKAQSELDSVGKGESGYGYNYASLAATIEIAKEPLANNGLSVTQLIGHIDREKKVGTVTTILLHSSGQFIQTESTIPLIDMKSCNDAQSFGAIVSYLRRYALQAILNLASEDTDASTKGAAPKKSSYSKSNTESKPSRNRGAKKEEAPKEEPIDDSEEKSEEAPAEGGRRFARKRKS